MRNVANLLKNVLVAVKRTETPPVSLTAGGGFFLPIAILLFPAVTVLPIAVL